MLFPTQIRKHSWKQAKPKSQHPLSSGLTQSVVKSFTSGQSYCSSFHTAPICPEEMKTWNTLRNNPWACGSTRYPKLFYAGENEGPVRTQQLVEIWDTRSKHGINSHYSIIFSYNLYLREKSADNSSKNEYWWPPSWLMMKTKWKKKSDVCGNT